MIRVNRSHVEILNPSYPADLISDLFDGRSSILIEDLTQWKIPTEDKIWMLIQLLDVLYKKMFAIDCIESIRHLIADSSTMSALNATYLYMFRHISYDQFSSLSHTAFIQNRNSPNHITDVILEVANLISSKNVINAHIFRETLRTTDLCVLKVANNICYICSDRHVYTSTYSLQYKPDIKDKIQSIQLARLVEWCIEPSRLYDDRRKLAQTFI